jgi:hypothetical protein
MNGSPALEFEHDGEGKQKLAILVPFYKVNQALNELGVF